MSEIYNIIDKKKLDVVKKPISKAHGLPNECYTSREYTFIERKKLFEDKWVVVGTASSLPNTGDIKPFDLFGIAQTFRQPRFFANALSQLRFSLLNPKSNQAH